MSAITKEQFVDYVKGLTLIQASELVKELEEIFGVTAAAPMAVAVGGGAAAAPAAEAQTEFTVILKDGGANKLNVIKEVRAITGLGLKEAKDMVEGAPKEVKAGVPKAEADDIKKKLVAAGATVDIK